MKSKLVIIVHSVLLAALLIGCARSSYIGKTYAPTLNVDLFMDASEIKRQYEVMGNITVDGDNFVSAEKLQAKMIEEAKIKGADAVLVEGMEEYVTSSTSTTSGSVSPGDRGGSNYNEKTTTTQSKRRSLKAKFLKYQN